MGNTAFVLSVVGAALLDQVTKTLVTSQLAEGRLYALCGRVGLRLVSNSRLGLLRMSCNVAISLWLVLVACVGLILLSFERLPFAGGIGLGLVLGGATSNLFDRLVRGSVVDFIAIRGWSTFNPADSLMVGGTLLAAWSIL